MTDINFYSALLFFFSALGLLNGLLLVVFSRAWFSDRLSSTLFGLLYFALTIRIGKTVALYFLPDLASWVIQVGLTACTFIGPLLYLFVIQHRLDRVSMYYFLHIMLPLVLMLIIGLAFPFSEYTEIWKNSHKVIYHYWLVYLVFAATQVHNLVPVQQWLSIKTDHKYFFVIHVLIGNILIWASYYTFKYTSVIAGAMTFSVVTYMLILLAFHTYVKNKNVKENRGKNPDNQKMPEVSNDEFEEKIKQMMFDDKHFKTSSLTLPNAAKILGTTPHRLSYYLNNVKKITYSDWVNGYRVQEAKRLLMTNERANIDSIAESCGYNSTSNFYSEFKKSTGMTPSNYRKSNK